MWIEPYPPQYYYPVRGVLYDICPDCGEITPDCTCNDNDTEEEKENEE